MTFWPFSGAPAALKYNIADVFYHRRTLNYASNCLGSQEGGGGNNQSVFFLGMVSGWPWNVFHLIFFEIFFDAIWNFWDIFWCHLKFLRHKKTSFEMFDFLKHFCYIFDISWTAKFGSQNRDLCNAQKPRISKTLKKLVTGNTCSRQAKSKEF